MAGTSKKGTGHATFEEGLEKAIHRAWEDAKDNNGAQPGDRLKVQTIEIIGFNPIHTYIVGVGP